ncbi:MAG: ATP-binding protein [Pseudomonadota bacterium]
MDQLATLKNLRMTAEERRRQFGTRIAIAFLGGTILWQSVSITIAAVYVGVVIVSQFIDRWLWIPALRADEAENPKSVEVYAAIGSVQASATYSLISYLLWFYGHDADKTIGVLWLAGSLLHVTMHMYHHRLTFIAALAPHAAYMFGLPAYALITGAELGRTMGALWLLAIMMYVGHLVTVLKSTRLLTTRLQESERAAREKQHDAEAATVSKSVFLANMSHEIRTPMNAILGMATSLLDDKTLGQKQRERLTVVRSSAEALLRILNDILDLSKVEAGKIEIEQTVFKLGNVAQSARDAFALKAEEKGLEFELTVDPSADGVFRGDPTRIMQVLNNLLSNATKFTEKGSVTALIDVETDAVGDDSAEEVTSAKDEEIRLRFTVKDTGPGLTDAEIKKLFKPFMQADGSVTRRHGGTGLGLSICKELCALMGGDVSVVSEVGVGSTFTFYVTVTHAGVREDANALNATNSAPNANEAVVAPERALPSMTVLAAEDNSVNQMVLKVLLEKFPVELVFVDNGRRAIEAWEPGRFDAILMDVQMPVLDGVEATLAIRKQEQELGSPPTPIFALTANAMRHQAEEYLSAGMDRVISKPVQINELIAALNEVCADGKNSTDNAALAS